MNKVATVERFMVICESGDIWFIKVVRDGSDWSTTVYAEYSCDTQTELDFAQEAQKRFANDYPDWDGIFDWQMICEDDLMDYLYTV